MSKKNIVLDLPQHKDAHKTPKYDSQMHFSNTGNVRSNNIAELDTDKNSFSQEMVFNIPKGKHG